VQLYEQPNQYFIILHAKIKEEKLQKNTLEITMQHSEQITLCYSINDRITVHIVNQKLIYCILHAFIALLQHSVQITLCYSVKDKITMHIN